MDDAVAQDVNTLNELPEIKKAVAECEAEFMGRILREQLDCGVAAESLAAMEGCLQDLGTQ